MKLLICDDEQPTLELLKNITDWKQLGITEIVTAPNGGEAKRIIQESPPDMLITDIVMPVMDGLELTKWIRSQDLEIPILIMSAYNEFEYAQQAIRFEVKGYLLKPLDEEKLEELVKEAVETIRNRENQKARLLTTKGFARERLLRQLLYPRQNLEEYRNLLNSLEIEVDFSTFRLALVSISQQFYNDYLDAAEESTSSSYNKVLKDLWIPDGNSWIFENSPGEFVIIVSSADSCGNMEERIQTFGEELTGIIKEPMAIALSREYHFLRNLPRAFSEASKYVEKRFLFDNHLILSADLFDQPPEQDFSEEHRERSSHIHRAKEYIAQHFAENISLDEICRHAGVSKNYFCHLFKGETGLSIWDFLTNYRIEKAKEFLAGSDLKNYEISYRIGYENPSYFSKTFKKITGLSPSEFRSQLKKMG